MTSLEMRNNIFVTPANAHERIHHFSNNKDERVLIVQGVSGIGKSIFLRNLEDTQENVFYVDVTAFRTPVAFIERAYQKATNNDDFFQLLQEQLFSAIDKPFNVGNITISNSALDNVDIDNSVTITYQTKLSDIPENLLFLKGFDLLASKAKIKRPIIILDQFELFASNDYVIAQIFYLLRERSYAKFILSSNKNISFKHPDRQGVAYFDFHGFTSIESIEFLENRNIAEKEVVNKLINFAKGHSWTLKNISDLVLAGLDLDLTLRNCSQDIKSKYILDAHHNDLIPEHYKEVFYYLPLCRIFNFRLVSHLFCISSYKVESTISWLLGNLYISRIGNSEFFRFHDIFREAQRKSLPLEEQNSIDVKVVDFYLHEKDKNDINTIEPFHHLQHCDPQRAFEYFEDLYKPALDRNKRNCTALLASQIELDIIRDDKAKHWFLFRLGGYFRQFNQHKKALEIFYDVVRYSRNAGNEVLEAYVLNNIGISQMYSGKLLEARESLDKSISICNKNNLIEIEGHNYTNLGLVYQHMGPENFDKSKAMYEIALRKYEESNASSIFVGMVLQNYAGILLIKKEYKKAIAAALAAEKEYLKTGDLVAGTKCRGIVTNVLLSMGRYRKAYEHQNEYMEKFEQIYKQYELSSQLLELYSVGMVSSFYIGRIIEAIEYAKKAILGSLIVNEKEHYAAIALVTRLSIEVGNGASGVFAKYVASKEDIPQIINASLIEHFKNIAINKYLIKGDNGIYHKSGCSAYRTGNYLTNTFVIGISADLIASHLDTCKCISLGNKALNK